MAGVEKAEELYIRMHKLNDLHLAILDGDLNEVETLLRKGADPNQCCRVTQVHAGENRRMPPQEFDSKGPSPIFLAAQIGHLGIVEALIRKRAMVNEEFKINRGVMTPLLAAASNGFEDVALKLLDSGARFENELIQWGRGGTINCLDLAAKHGMRALTRRALQARAPANIPLHKALQRNHLEVFRMLCGTYAGSMHQRNDKGHTPLQAAAILGKEEFFDLCIQNGANPLETGGYGIDRDVTLLHYTVIGKNIRLVARAIGDFRIGVNTKTQQEFTALEIAISQQDTQMIRYLLSVPDINVFSRFPFPPNMNVGG